MTLSGHKQDFESLNLYSCDVMMNHRFKPFNSIVTGSGKSYTMMGAPGADEGGIIPRLCDALFERIAVQQSPPALTYKVRDHLEEL